MDGNLISEQHVMAYARFYAVTSQLGQPPPVSVDERQCLKEDRTSLSYHSDPFLLDHDQVFSGRSLQRFRKELPCVMVASAMDQIGGYLGYCRQHRL